MKEALIFDIQRFSLHDGPGIRTLIFFKGCSLTCEWCSNPEGIRFEPELRNDRRLCAGCGKCLQNCPSGAVSAGREGIAIDRVKCRKCGVCVENCTPKALSWWGQWYTVQQLYDQARRDKPFYESSGGGVTLGGGDPLLQNKPAIALLKICRENGINTAIETAGNYKWEYLENAAPYCDTIHFDLKAWNGKTSRRCTGVDNTRILENLRRLDSLIAGWEVRPRLIVRAVIMPGNNYTPENFREAAVFFGGLRALERLELLPFHNLGEYKYDQLERPYRFRGNNNLKAEDLEEYKSILEQMGLPVTVSTI